MYKVSKEQFYKNLEELRKAKKILEKIYDLDTDDIFDLSEIIFCDLAKTIMNTMGIIRSADQDIFFNMIYDDTITNIIRLSEEEIKEYQTQEITVITPYEKFYEYIIENKIDYLGEENV